MDEELRKPFTQDDVARALALVEQKYPELFERLVRSEIEDRPELREGGMPLILTLEREGLDYGRIGTIFFAAEFRQAIIRKYT